jgi:glycosyltransferase involved in cell wall biosynthesis
MADERLSSLPVLRPSIIMNIDRLLIKLLANIPPETKFIVFVGQMVWGGAEYYASSLYLSLVRKYGRESVAMIVTDAPIIDSIKWLGVNPNLILLDSLQPMLDYGSKIQIMRNMLSAVRPDAIFNVNSYCVWNMLVQSGRSVRRLTDVYSCLFCYDLRENGMRLGYARLNLPGSIEHHAGLLFDNDSFRAQISEDLALPSSMKRLLRTLFTPVDSLCQAEQADTKTGPASIKRVLWAGRFVFQKQPLLALEVARRLSSAQFDFYGGGGPLFLQREMRTTAPSNVTFKGTFESMESLPLKNYDALLYTSVIDGIPTVLLASGQSRLPIIASCTGGIPELITDKTGWPIVDRSNAQAYAEALQFCLSNPTLAKEKANNLHHLISDRHNAVAFDKSLSQLLDSRV